MVHLSAVTRLSSNGPLDSHSTRIELMTY